MTVSDQIIQVLNALCAKFGMAIDWTSENVLPYVATLCTKLVTYEIWTSVAWMAIMAVLSIIAIIVTVVFRERIRNMWDDDNVPMIFLMIFFVIVWFATIIVLGTQVMDIIKCHTFPEMYVFEYVNGLINAKS